MTRTPVLQVQNLHTRFHSAERGKFIQAVDDVSLELFPGEIVGLVGESGCGKSTLGRTIVGLEKAHSGRVLLDGTDLSTLHGAEARARRRALQYVFQDPYSSLNDRQTVGETLDEALRIAGMAETTARHQRLRELLEQVGLAEAVRDRHTRELSGGQRQRVAIARSLAVNPRVLICDEPVSALDLSIRAQVMNLLLSLRQDLGVACLFIAHDLALVRQAASRVYVMYLGKIVETGPSQELYDRPGHPYAQLLLASAPEADPEVERHRTPPQLIGEIPSPINPPSGCRFRTRCPMAVAACSQIVPPAVELAAGHSAACLFAADIHAGRRTALPAVRPAHGRTVALVP